MEGKKVVRTNAAEVTEVLLQSRLKKVGLVIKAELDLQEEAIGADYTYTSTGGGKGGRGGSSLTASLREGSLQTLKPSVRAPFKHLTPI